MSEQISVNNAKLFFFDVALVLYVFWGAFRDADPSIANILLFSNTYLAYLSVVFSLLSIINRYDYSLSKTLVFLFITAMSFYFKREYQYLDILPLSFLIFAASGATVDHIVKTCLNATILSTLLICGLCFLGFLPDKVFVHYFNDYSSMDSHTMGFFYYSGFSYRALIIIVMSLYVHRKKCSNYKLLGLLVFALISFFISATRLQLLLSLAFILFFVFAYKLNFVSFKKKVWKYFALFFYPVAFIFYITLSLVSFLLPDVQDFWDDEFNGRMGQTIIGFAQYGISLWGNKLEMVGSATAETTMQEYFYIDSGYAYWILAYGVIFTLFILFSYSYVFKRAYEAKETFLFFWLALFAVANINNDFFSLSYYCPTIFFLYAGLTTELQDGHSF